MMNRIQRRLQKVSLAVAVGFATAIAVQAEFDPPRVIHILRVNDTGGLPDSLLKKTSYYINKGVETNINRGDVLNVYREKRLAPEVPRPLRIFIGTMTITDSQPGSSVGRFTPNESIEGQPLIRYKSPVKYDIVIPRLIIDSEVLFEPGAAALKKGAEAEFEKVGDFVKNFSPSKLIIEGHTDSDGDLAYNQRLSEERAKNVRGFLVNNPRLEGFITENMIDAVGYGEERPIVPNDSPENKKLNRRIEVIIWE